MAKHFDLEEQEQLAELKHFWSNYGNALTWTLIVVLLVVLGWLSWGIWTRNQAERASQLYDEVERAAQAGDVALLNRASTDIRERYGRTTYASQAALLAARIQDEKKEADAARASLQWVADNGADDGYKAVGRLRLAAVLIQANALDDALKALAPAVPASFEALVFDRRGDIYMKQGKREEAKAEYMRAYERMERGADIRQLVEIKLNALGVDPLTLKGNTPASAGSTEAAKS